MDAVGIGRTKGNALSTDEKKCDFKSVSPGALNWKPQTLSTDFNRVNEKKFFDYKQIKCRKKINQKKKIQLSFVACCFCVVKMKLSVKLLLN